MADEALITQDDLIPRPDPTKLTGVALTDTKTDLRREMAAMHQLTYARIDGLEALLTRVQDIVDLAPKERDDLRHRLQTDINTSVGNLRELHAEKFAAIQQQFNERDTRGEQEKKAAKEALDAALLAQKESVSQQNDANTTAATKSETSFTKQIDQIGTLIATLEKSLTDRITELKERIDRGEGSVAGSHESRADRRLDLGAVIAAIAVVVAIASVVALILKK